MENNVATNTLARLYGEPLFKMPTDLYIPPDALTVFLEAFEGPLDLLLYLIKKQSFNVLDIPMAALTQQYLLYVDEIRQHNLELAADYLLMAAMLIEIKSRLLLPPKKTDNEDETLDPRAELVRRLLEYEQMKWAAQQIDALPQAGRDFWVTNGVWVEKTKSTVWPIASVLELQQAWQDLFRRAQLAQHHTISAEGLSVREHMSHILRELQNNNHKFVVFESLFDCTKGVPVLVVTFVAMLELAKEMLIDITQAAAFAPIYVCLAYTPHSVQFFTQPDTEPKIKPALP